jgi:intermediate peptidase
LVTCFAFVKFREYVEEATKATLRINEYLHYLNTHHTLYNAVIKAEKDHGSLTPEARRVACFLRDDFEKGGIHLPSEKVDQVNQLNIEISQLCTRFNENIAVDPGQVDIFPGSRIPKHLHHLGTPIYRSTSADYCPKEKGFRIETDPHTLSSILQYVSDSEVRKMAYVQGNSFPKANLDVLDNLIASRHEIAQIFGHKSYVEYALKSNMASSPEVVKSFLLEMSNMVRPMADKEFNAVSDYKRQQNGQLCGSLEPWDEAYFTALMKSSAYNLDLKGVSSYFPLSQCIEGLKVIVESLFGVKFHSVPLLPRESWHKDVTKMCLHHPEEGDLGYLYLDLYSRSRKYPGCAHFSIKGGRKISESEYQIPVVALVCNFSSSRKSSVLLNHTEVETLFHEFGHALHSLLSRTDYQHFSGTRVVFDLAETPSNLFEYYAWDYRVLKTFAKHYSTGEVIPEKMVESMQGAKRMFAATELQRQIYYALIDQNLFGEETLSTKDTVSIVADLKNKHTSWKHVDDTHWHTRFSHLLNYGAGYYSYLYAKCFASTIWDKICKDDPLSLETGSALRTKFLQHGGAKDPASILIDLVKNNNDDHHGILMPRDGGGIIPDLTCLCQEMGLPNKSNH